ncbi:hypothetical protein E4U10_006015 [Claviceps purpurea]|nr:hypothetical protein E4U10_006015 [Claviceps purpurea]
MSSSLRTFIASCTDQSRSAIKEFMVLRTADVLNDETWLSPHVPFKTLTYAILTIMKHKLGSAPTEREDHARAVLMLHKPHLRLRPREDVVDEDGNDALGNPDEGHSLTHVSGSLRPAPAKTNTTNWSSPAMDIPDSNDSGESNNTERTSFANRDSTSNETGGLRSSTSFVKAILEIRSERSCFDSGGKGR